MTNFPPIPNSDPLESLMTGYVLNTLTPEEIQELEQALKVDPHLQKQLRDYQEVMGLLAHTAVPIAAPAELRGKILSLSNPKNNRKQNPKNNLVHHKIRLKINWQTGLNFIAAGLIVALGLNTVNRDAMNAVMNRKLHEMESIVASLQSDEAYIFTMHPTKPATIGSNQPKPAQTASGHVILDLDRGNAIVALRNLPALPAGEVYTVWATVRDQKIFCGQIKGDGGNPLEQLAIDKAAYTSDATAMEIFSTPQTDLMKQNPDRLIMVSQIPAEPKSEES